MSVPINHLQHNWTQRFSGWAKSQKIKTIATNVWRCLQVVWVSQSRYVWSKIYHYDGTNIKTRKSKAQRMRTIMWVFKCTHILYWAAIIKRSGVVMEKLPIIFPLVFGSYFTVDVFEVETPHYYLSAQYIVWHEFGWTQQPPAIQNRATNEA